MLIWLVMVRGVCDDPKRRRSWHERFSFCFKSLTDAKASIVFARPLALYLVIWLFLNEDLWSKFNADHFQTFKEIKFASCRNTVGHDNVELEIHTYTPMNYDTIIILPLFSFQFPLLCHFIFNLVVLRSSCTLVIFIRCCCCCCCFCSPHSHSCYTIFFDESKQLIGFSKS